jgi:hypothetical protein
MAVTSQHISESQLDKMRFSVFSVAICLASTLAAPLNHEKRDLSIIETSVKQVIATLSTLDQALKGQKPTADQIDQQKYIKWLLNMDSQVQSALAAGSGKIWTSPNINELDAARLVFVMEPMLKDTQSTMKGWISIKAIAQSAGMLGAVRDQLSRGATESSGFADAIIGRLPALNRAIGQTFKSSIMRPIDNTIRTYAT